MDISQGQFMLMYSLYSWPNVVLCFFGGFLMDRVLGLRFVRFVSCVRGIVVTSYITKPARDPKIDHSSTAGRAV